MTIDWIAFVDSLDEHNFHLLSKSVHMRKMDIAEAEADKLVLSFAEVEMARSEPVVAIKMINDRLKCGLIVAKLAVDIALENDDDLEEEEGAPTVFGGSGDDEQNLETSDYESLMID